MFLHLLKIFTIADVVTVERTELKSKCLNDL